jgi:two-component system sensor histidine kinase/response regulator
MTKKILIIEDEKDIQDSLKTILELSDYAVAVADNGEEGMQKTAEVKPDLILCDVMMPVMDGFQFLKLLREKGIDIPLIFLTAKAQYEYLRTGMNLGADDYLFKPFKSADLLKSIERRLNRKIELQHSLQIRINSLESTISLMVGHEFNTPIHGIASFTNLIKRRASELAISEIEEFCQHLDSSTNRLKNTFQKVKMYYELKNDVAFNAISKNSNKIDELLSTIAVRVANDRRRSQDLEMHINTAVEFLVSEELFPVALYELIDNAFKFSKQGDAVIVSVSGNPDGIVIEIQDSGETSNAAEVKNQVGELGQINRNLYEQQGLGVGLALSSLIITSQNGTLAFEDILPQGIKAVILLRNNR